MQKVFRKKINLEYTADKNEQRAYGELLGNGFNGGEAKLPTLQLSNVSACAPRGGPSLTWLRRG
jgi:hypothetical protein